MSRIDCNCFVGTWPFHYVRGSRFEDLKKLHSANNIEYGYVSSTEAIFYNDPYEADCRLAKEIAGSGYQHVITVNPTLPGCCDSVRRMVSEFPVAGVRVLPGFHDYTLLDQGLNKLYDLMCELHLPLLLTLRMEDERMAYMFHQKSIPVWDIDMFVSTHTDIPILICNCRNAELSFLANTLRAYDHISVDCSGLKNAIFGIDEYYEQNLLDKMVYGSVAPIFCMKSTVLLVETGDVPEEIKDKIFSGDAFIKKIKSISNEQSIEELIPACV